MAVSPMYSRKYKSSPQKSFSKKPPYKRSTNAQYRTIEDEENVGLEKPLRSYKKRSPGKENPTMDRAKEVQAKLPSAFPSFVKHMVRSNVSSCFWLGLSRKFCVKNMPKDDAMMVLEDEKGKVEETKYLWQRTGLSGGWKQFSRKHHLVEGDVLVFHLIKPRRFKVYICRKNGSCSAEIDRAVEVMNLDVQSRPLAAAVENGDEIEKNDEMIAPVNTSEDSPDESDELSPKVMEGITSSDSFVEFKDVKPLDDFSISVDGLVIDSAIPTDIRAKYYKLCLSQKGYLHSHIKGLKCSQAAGVIIRAVKVFDAMRSANITTPLKELVKWKKSLEWCEDMGMELGFLRSHLSILIELQMKVNERAQVEEEMKVKRAINMVDAEIEVVLKKEIAGPARAISRVAKEPW